MYDESSVANKFASGRDSLEDQELLCGRCTQLGLIR